MSNRETGYWVRSLWAAMVDAIGADMNGFRFFLMWGVEVAMRWEES